MAYNKQEKSASKEETQHKPKTRKTRSEKLNGKLSQASFSNNTITLRVKKTHFIGRIFLFTGAFLMVLGPMASLLIPNPDGNTNMFMVFLILGLLLLLGFRLLRLALWNTYGSETIQINGPMISYTANYGWFKDKIKTIKVENIGFDIFPIGYAEDGMGLLWIGNETESIQSAAKVPIDALANLITEIESRPISV